MALRYWVGGTDNWNATAGTKWALTSGGAGGQAVPTSADDVFLDAASGANTVTITSTATAKSLNCTGFTGTLAGVIALNVSGSVTLSATMTQNYTGILSILALSTIISNGKSITSITIATASTITISGVLNVTNFQYGSGVATSVNGSTINISGNLATSNNTGSGTALLNMIGTGTLTGTALANNITINTTGAITTVGFGMGAGTFTYIPNTGTFTPSGTCTFNGSTINSSGISWIGITLTNNITLTSVISISGLLTLSGTPTITGVGFLTSCGSLTTASNSTYTLANNLTVTGDYIVAGSTTFAGTYSIFIGGNLTVQATRLVISTAVTLVLNTASTATWSHASGGYIGANLIINKPLGTLILSTNVYYRTNTLTYTAGTVDTTTNNSTLNIEAASTLNTNGINWNNVTITAGTQTLTSDLNVLNLTVSNTAGVTFTNSGGNIYISGNLLHTGTGAILGTASINLIGTGTWNDTSSQDIRNNLNINTTGTITLGTNLNYMTGTLTHISGNVITTGSTLNITASCTLNTSGINWNNISIIFGTTTLSSELNVLNFIVNGTNNPVLQSNKINVFGNLQIDGTNIVSGTAEIILVGTGTWSNSSNGEIKNNLTINTNGTIKLGTNVYISNGTFKYLSGKINTKNSTFNITGTGTTTLINCHKINFDNVRISPSHTLLMNEFFSGSPLMPINIASTSVLNYTISFQDNFEKIAKFVNISNCTLTRPMQLLVVTNSKKSSTNRGIRYINQSPNGIAKNEPSTLVQTTYGTQMLLNDPAMN